MKTRKENPTAVRVEVANIKHFRKLIDQWTDAVLQRYHLKTRLGLHSDAS